ncbi:MAG: hypothetical protein MUQ00_11560 [Candidatus Aminicenantes bacterium]|nr:hypothetical protein [Candidatus Aminicenantes bacterium]
MKKVAALVLVSLFLASMAVVNPPKSLASDTPCRDAYLVCRQEALASNVGVIKTAWMLTKCDFKYVACVIFCI